MRRKRNHGSCSGMQTRSQSQPQTHTEPLLTQPPTFSTIPSSRGSYPLANPLTIQSSGAGKSYEDTNSDTTSTYSSQQTMRRFDGPTRRRAFASAARILVFTIQILLLLLFIALWMHALSVSNHCPAWERITIAWNMQSIHEFVILMVVGVLCIMMVPVTASLFR